MQRMLTRAGILVALLVAPALAFAAFDTVSLGTNTAISVGGIEVDISGSAAVIESLVVNTNSTFTFTLQSGSSIKVAAPSRNVLGTDTSADITTSACSATESSITYTGTAARTVTITPSSTLCASSGGGSGGSSGGGGGGTTSATSATPATPAVPTVSPAVPATPATPAASATPASGLSVSQIQSILSVLASFDVDASTMASVKAALEGTATGSVTSAAVHAFKSDLFLGSLGSEVKALQQFLNSHGYPVAASGAGSSGNETTKFGPATKAALIKFQKAKGITPAAGYFGSKTRAAIDANE